MPLRGLLGLGFCSLFYFISFFFFFSGLDPSWLCVLGAAGIARDRVLQRKTQGPVAAPRKPFKYSFFFFSFYFFSVLRVNKLSSKKASGTCDAWSPKLTIVVVKGLF